MLRSTVWLLLCTLLPWTALAMRADHMARLRQDAVDMFYHGWNNYMKHAFPEDELRPLTCAPLTRNRNDPREIGLNDALGNYSLTLIDSLSTLAVLAGSPETEANTGPQALSDFQDGVAKFVKFYGDGREGAKSAQGVRSKGFDLDSKVQVFETVIRGLGGLLSAHLFAIGELPMAGYSPRPTDPPLRYDDPLELAPIRWPNGFRYDGQLLRLALDLGKRLLPAFYTHTGIPYPRVNLRHGIPFYRKSPLNGASEDDMAGEDEDDQVGREREITETCSAGAGSLTLEFTVLSRLSGDARFEQAAKRAFWEVWGRRSALGLIGNGIDAEVGAWIGPHAGIGAGMDSFFEYALKSHILLSGSEAPNASIVDRVGSGAEWLDPTSIHGPLHPDLHTSDAFLQAWHQAHASVKRHLYTDRNAYPYYSNNNRVSGQPYTSWIDSLGAFYPGLLALAGEVDEAIEANLVYTALWTRYSALPERWSFGKNDIDSGIGWWPGRPEFIESTYYIYRATRDPWYLYVGEMILRDIKWRCYAPCGWAGLQDVRSGEKQDRMESFFLGETAKYMYLLFDPDHLLNKLDAPYVFSTEGHPLIIPKRRRAGSQKSRGKGQWREVPTSVSTYTYYDEAFTNTCPNPRIPDGFSKSATASRQNLFGVSRFTDLYNTPNLHGPLEKVLVQDNERGKVTKWRPISNHTLFPWTLPPQLLPSDGTCTAPADRLISWIEFPAQDTFSAVKNKLKKTITWKDPARNGPVVHSLEGLRLQLEKKAREGFPGEFSWRITHVAGVEIGQHASVYFYAEHTRHMQDEAFTVVRRTDKVQIEMLVDPTPPAEEANASVPLEGSPESPEIPEISPSTAPEPSQPDPSKSLLRSLLRAVSSVFEPTNTELPDALLPPGSGGPLVYSWLAYTAVGLGAFPVPPILDTPVVNGPSFNRVDPASNYPWKSIYLAGHACDETLPDKAPREHQVIVMLRGKCSFSSKIDRIPSFPPSAMSLQLVVVVDVLDEHGDGGDIRPLLESEQVTPKGVKRVPGIALAHVGGASGDYELMGRAAGMGMRRRYSVQSQGMTIENAVVL